MDFSKIMFFVFLFFLTSLGSIPRPYAAPPLVVDSTPRDNCADDDDEADGFIVMDDDIMITNTGDPTVVVTFTEVYAISGELVFFISGCYSFECREDLAHLPPGFYVARARTSLNEIIVQKIILD